MTHPLEEKLFNSVAEKGWRTLGVRNHHGICIFLSALRTATSGGIGEFLDLIPLVDWCHDIGMDILQLLPLNDSGFDPSPYNPFSSCALNPAYLKLSALPYLEGFPELQKEIESLYPYNSLPHTAYADVLEIKMQWLRKYFIQASPLFEKDGGVLQFKTANPWVVPYTLFKTLLFHFKGADWETWPPEFQNLKPDHFEALVIEHQKEIAFHLILQYLCFQQLSQVRLRADKKGVFLKGDLPILVSRNSVDVWHNPEFFDLTYSAGHPADQFTTEGQYWGFPLFNWENLKKIDYSFWRARLQAANNFYHAYRIDHAVGFFRIWAIPLHQPSRTGHYIPEDPNEYLAQGTKLLSVLALTSPMLPIAEDLGNVPESVKNCLMDMGIPGTRVMRWEVDWTKTPAFTPIKDYPPISMTCVSSHDSETLSGWWKQYPSQASEFAKEKHWIYTPKITREQLEQLLWDSHHTTSLFHINLLQEYLALFPELVAPTPEEERINTPGTMLSNNWTYRYRPNLETITTHKELFATLESLIKKAPT